jgi:hypothetical protein
MDENPKTVSPTEGDNTEPRAREVDVATLERLWIRGRKAWANVPSATAWVEAMRGNASRPRHK